MLPRDADAAVELHAVLQDLGGVVAEVRLRPRSRSRPRRDRRPAPRAPRRSVTPWHASSHIFMSAMRCLSAWYDASGRPNELRSPRYSRVNSSTRSSAPTVSAHCSTIGELQLALDGVGRAADLAHDADRRRTRTPSKCTVAKRRTRSTDSIGSTCTPGADAGTRHWVSPPSVRAVTSSSSACAAVLDRRADAVEHEASIRRGGAVAGRGDGHAVRVPAAAGPGDAPRGHDLAGDDPGQHLGPQLSRIRRGRRRRRRRWWARAVPATRAAPSPRPRSRGRPGRRPRGCRRRRPRARGTTSSRAPRPAAHQARSKPSGSSARARTVVIGASCSRNLRVVSWKNC